MLEAALPLRRAIYGLLNGNVSYQGNTIPVYDSYAPDDVPTPYIIIDNISESDNSDKCNFGQNLLVTYNVVTEYILKSSNGRYDSEMIANEMTKVLLPQRACGELYQLPGFQCVRANKVNGQSITELSDTTKIFRKVIQISYTIKQLNNG